MGRCVEGVSMTLIVTINVIFFLGSGLMLGLGITAKSNPEAVGKVVSYILPIAIRDHLTAVGVDLSNIVVSNGTFLIVIGGIGIFVAGIGFIGACCRIRLLLILYTTLMIILMLGQVALIIFAYVYPDIFRNFIQQNMISSLQMGFRDEIKIDVNDVFVMPTGMVEIGWFSIQIKEKCCGARNWTDYSSFEWNNEGLVPSSVFAKIPSVPISCCAQKAVQGVFPPTLDSFVDLSSCLLGIPAFINRQNCYDAIEKELASFIRSHQGLAIGIAVIVGAAELTIIIMAILLLKKPHMYVRFVNSE